MGGGSIASGGRGWLGILRGGHHGGLRSSGKTLPPLSPEALGTNPQTGGRRQTEETQGKGVTRPDTAFNGNESENLNSL